MRISKSNPIQFWLTSQLSFNEAADILGIDKKLFFQQFLNSDLVRTDVEFDSLSAQTWSALTTYSIGDLAYSTLSGLRHKSVTDGNINKDPSEYPNFLTDWGLADFTFDLTKPHLGPFNIDIWRIGVTYNTGDRCFSGASGHTPFVYESVSDGNLGNDPEAVPNLWKKVIQDPNVNKMRGYIDGVIWNEFDFVNVNTVDPNQAVDMDLSIYPELIDHFTQLKIFSATIAPSLKPSSDWLDLLDPWDSEHLTMPPYFEVFSFLPGSPRKSYQSIFGKIGQAFAIRYKVTVTGAFSGFIKPFFNIVDITDSDAATYQYSVTGDPDFDTFGGTNIEINAPGEYIITEIITLTALAHRIYVNLTGSFFGGSPDVVIDEIEGIAIASDELAHSDCLQIKEEIKASTLVEYTNLSDYDGIAYRDSHAVFRLRLIAHFWEEDDPTDSEDYPDSKGDVITLRNSTTHKRLLSTTYMPAYMHEKLVHIFNHDYQRIEGVIYKRRAGDNYNRVRIDRSTMYAGSVWLTEQGSVLVNIGGSVAIAERIFDDSFDDTFE